MPHWIVHGEDFAQSVKHGRLTIDQSRTFTWELGDIDFTGPVDIAVDFNLNWIGQIFLSTGGDESYLLFNDVLGFSPGDHFIFRMRLEGDKASIHLGNSDENLREPKPWDGQLTRVVFRPSQSELTVNSIKITEVQTGRLLASENFGPDLNFINVAAFALGALILILILLEIEAWLAERFLRWSKSSVKMAIVAAYLPLAFIYLLASQGAFENVFDDLGVSAFFLHLFYAYAANRRAGKSPTKYYTYAVLVVPAAAGLYFFGRVFYVAGWPMAYFGVLVFLLILLTSLVFFGQRNEKGALSKPVIFTTGALWAIPALSAYILSFFKEEFDLVSVGCVLSLASGFVALRLLSVRKKQIRYYQGIALLTACLCLAAFECALSRSPYANRFRPLNVGKDFQPDDVLFFAPKSLFVSPVTQWEQDDFEVNKINFRSGPATKEKPAVTYRILALGGSNTWGQWIDDPAKTWIGRLESKLNGRTSGKNVEIINAGVKGYNLFQLLVLYEHYLKDYQVDALLLYINTNDRSAGNRKGLFTYRELYALRQEGKLDEVVKSIEGGKPKRDLPAWLPKVHRKLQNQSTYNALTKAVLAFRSSEAGMKIAPENLKSLNPIQDYLLNLEQFLEFANQRNLPLILCDEFSYFPDADDKVPDDYSKAMKQFATVRKVLFFPAHDYLADNFKRSELVFPWDTVHLNEFGSEILAQGLADFLIESKIIK